MKTLKYEQLVKAGVSTKVLASFVNQLNGTIYKKDKLPSLEKLKQLGLILESVKPKTYDLEIGRYTQWGTWETGQGNKDGVFTPTFVPVPGTGKTEVHGMPIARNLKNGDSVWVIGQHNDYLGVIIDIDCMKGFPLSEGNPLVAAVYSETLIIHPNCNTIENKGRLVRPADYTNEYTKKFNDRFNELLRESGIIHQDSSKEDRVKSISALIYSAKEDCKFEI